MLEVGKKYRFSGLIGENVDYEVLHIEPSSYIIRYLADCHYGKAGREDFIGIGSSVARNAFILMS